MDLIDLREVLGDGLCQRSYLFISLADRLDRIDVIADFCPLLPIKPAQTPPFLFAQMIEHGIF